MPNCASCPGAATPAALQRGGVAERPAFGHPQPAAGRYRVRNAMSEDAAYQATTLGESYARVDRLPVTVLLDNVRSL